MTNGVANPLQYRRVTTTIKLLDPQDTATLTDQHPTIQESPPPFPPPLEKSCCNAVAVTD